MEFDNFDYLAALTTVEFDRADFDAFADLDDLSNFADLRASQPSNPPEL